MHCKKLKKIAIFLGDFFWSSHPYDGLELYEKLHKENFEVNLIMFSGDIRLNKTKFSQEKFYFDSSRFHQAKGLITVKNWSEFSNCASKFDMIISSAHVAPKTRMQRDIRKTLKKDLNWFCWDIGGADILTNTNWFADGYFVKGEKWKNWIVSLRPDVNVNNIFVSGSPHYDGYLDHSKDEEVLKKYNLVENQFVLVSPSNPSSHLEMYQANARFLEQFVSNCKSRNLEVCVKTHPSDYLYFEEETSYSGVYRRSNGLKQPQWKELSTNYGMIAIESQDGASIMKNAKFLYNISGSHLSWETHFTKRPSFTMNYSQQKFYKSVSYLKNVVYPDERYNIELSDVDAMFEYDFFNHTTDHPQEFILPEHSIQNIVNFLKTRC